MQTVRVAEVINCIADCQSRLDSYGDYSTNLYLMQILMLCDCGITLVARPTLVHNTAIRKLKTDYPWTIEPNPDSWSEYDSEKSPPPAKQASSLPHGYITDRG
ncbi:MAG: hypothetical protein EZS28_046189 [Streblomastix strix]|uniref:Uncharacterized protein n=1 Tax=Streblomastix strix TaxID=222440 RepID=A0A5J4TL80_9EUKA|nr:MAG: hypothetical protein EZS28_046189 [Streblomastix strix]